MSSRLGRPYREPGNMKEPLHLVESAKRKSPIKAPESLYLWNNRQRTGEKQQEGETKKIDEEGRQKHRGASLDDGRIVRS